MSGPNHPRGTSNTNDRGSAAARRARKQRMLDEFGDGQFVVCRLCWAEVLNFDTVTADRWPVAGVDGGRYVWGNIRPVSLGCNSRDGNRLREERRARLVLQD